jgi:hypothetical protein
MVDVMTCCSFIATVAIASAYLFERCGISHGPSRYVCTTTVALVLSLLVDGVASHAPRHGPRGRRLVTKYVIHAVLLAVCAALYMGHPGPVSGFVTY